MIPYGRQDISEADIEAVVAVLRSDFLTQGPMVPRFERLVAEHCGVSHALAVNSATSALHLSCLALGLRAGDMVWTSPITFVASANCALYCGADVDFVDIDPRTYNLCPRSLKSKLSRAAKAGRLPKVVIPVHFGGQPCDMAAIHSLSEEYGFRVIEDASHAIGGAYAGQPVGSCQYSDIAVFSFHPVKMITTAEGGMALTGDDELAEKMRLLRSHGITRDPARMSEACGDWHYEQICLGYNYRMTDMQAALGASQLERLGGYLDRRHSLARRYDKALLELPVTTPWQDSKSRSAYHLYVIRLRLDSLTKSRRQIFEELRGMGVGVNVHYIPVHLQPFYRRMGFAPGDFPEAEAYYSDALTLPLYPTLTDAKQAHVVDVLRKVLAG